MPAHTSERILDAAEKICRTEGADALSMRRMAEELGITATALYRHYGGKDELLDAVAERGFEKLAADFTEARKKRSPLFDLMVFSRRPGGRRFPGDFARGASPSANVLVELLKEMNVKEPLDVALLLWAEAQGLIALQRAGRFENEAAFQRAWDRCFARVLSVVS